MEQTIRREAVFSPCREYRYTLERYWDESLPRYLWILLNPSTADATKDDPTNKLGMDYVRGWGGGSCIFVNLFAFRSPYPRVMKAAEHPVGPLNDRFLLAHARLADRIVVAWGGSGGHRGRNLEVLELLKGSDLWALGTTKHGHPFHPLRKRRDLELEKYSGPQ